MSESVLVYGSDHSPWVQTVLLALEQRGIPYHVVHFPLSISSYWKRGMIMPTCRWPDGKITSDSFAILAEIDKRYPKPNMEPIIPSDQKQVAHDQSRLELLFVLYVLTRFAWGNKWRFVHAWSQMVPFHPNSLVRFSSHIVRATMTLYFVILIQGGIWSQTRKNKPIYKDEHVQRELRIWCERLGTNPYLGGEQPCYLDFALLGQLQCMSSGLTDFIFPLLQQETSLMHWLERMHALLHSHRYLHSRRILSPSPITSSPSIWGVVIFYFGLFTQIVFVPFTFGVLLHAFVIRRNNPARTMGVLQSTPKEN